MVCKPENDVEKVLFSTEKLDKKTTELADELNKFYTDEEVVAVGILKGSIPFYWELIKKVSFPVTFDFMMASSYGSCSESSGKVQILKDISVDIEGKNVLIIEDILDTGNTLLKLKNYLLARNPKDIKICCLLDKPTRRTQNISADYVGYEIDDYFVVGYGLDYAEKYRQLPYIGVLKASIYSK